MPPAAIVHGTAIALGDRAALIRGAPGSGKSDLALRCLLHPVSALIPCLAALVSDDQVALSARDGRLFASAPETIRGKIEVRGVGIIETPAVSDPVALALVIDLTERGLVERMPDFAEMAEVSGVRIPLMRLYPWEISAASKALLALAQADDGAL